MQDDTGRRRALIIIYSRQAGDQIPIEEKSPQIDLETGGDNWIFSRFRALHL